MFNSNASSAASDANYIEDVFSTYLYTGNSSTQAINNAIDLSTKGGLVWLKSRSGVQDHYLFDTLRGTNSAIFTDSSVAAQAYNFLDSFNTNGFTLNNNAPNTTGNTYASWTFREQPKFFDVVTYTGNGTTNDVAHALASVPGFVVIKKTSTTSNWYTLNRDSSGNYLQGYLNTTGSLPQVWVAANTSTYLTSTTLKIASLASVTGEDLNASGTTYVAYIFAHDAGGFGLTGTDNVISCGSFTTDASGNIPTTTLGYEPQWILVKPTGTTGNWVLFDNMRGLALSTSGQSILYPNLSNAEGTASPAMYVNATGFSSGAWWATSTQHIYIAIRRGPMKVPTDGTKVFAPVTYTGDSTNRSVTAGFPADFAMVGNRGSAAAKFVAATRLTGNPFLVTSDTAAESSDTTVFQANPFDNQTAVNIGAGNSRTNLSGSTYVLDAFARAPSFFDEVCYTGNGATNRSLSHNLGTAPEFYFCRERTGSAWWTYHSGCPSPAVNQYLKLNTTDAATSAGVAVWGGTNTTFDVYVGLGLNTSATNYVAYLFATCAGVSKVGSYTGTGTTQQINCGFTAGSRFVLIKRTDSTGDWYVWDSARGIVAGNDPYLLLNSTAAEVTSTDYVDTYAAGFELTSTAPAAINASGGTYIFLAIA